MQRAVLLLALVACAGCDGGAPTEHAPAPAVVGPRVGLDVQGAAALGPSGRVGWHGRLEDTQVGGGVGALKGRHVGGD